MSGRGDLVTSSPEPTGERLLSALSSAPVSVRQVDVDAGWAIAGDPSVWEDAGLSSTERASAASGETLSRRRRSQWLAGRIAVKDAALDLLTARQPGRSSLCRQDVEVWAKPSGALGVRCAQDADGSSVLVSVCHSHTRAVALAVFADEVASVGIDLEGHGSWQVVWRQGLATEERATLSRQQRGPAEHGLAHQVIGLWCAKEAAVKAWRTGFEAHGGPRGVGAHYRGDRRVVVRPGGRLPHLPTIEARNATSREWTMAVAVVPMREYACVT
jgi:phosphopantetheinyl transferase (holo-ACP synthase)